MGTGRFDIFQFPADHFLDTALEHKQRRGGDGESGFNGRGATRHFSYSSDSGSIIINNFIVLIIIPMNQSSSFKTIHAIGVALAAAMAAVFLWSTLGAAAFNGPTQNPSGGNGAISSDASNNVYIGGNLNVTGTITGSGLGGSTISAGNVSAGDFGSNTGGGTYAFPGLVYIGASSTCW